MGILSKKPGGSLSTRTPTMAMFGGRSETQLFHSGIILWQWGQPAERKKRTVTVPFG